MSNGSGVPAATGRAGWWNEISRRVRERDIDRQLLYNRVRNAGTIGGRVPPLLGEFLQVLPATVLAFWIIASLLSWWFDAQPLYAYAAFGLVYSLRATYHTYRLSVDPTYRIRRCKCAGAARDQTEQVLGSADSTILGVPNSVLSAAYYVALALLVYAGQDGAAMFLSAPAVAASAYLSYVMVARIGALCTACINLSALNLLLLLQLLR